jgi:glycosyltransferase involved in cell wall biosynthesis
MKNLVFTVINDLNYDQRMIRICRSLQAAGYKVTLVGRHFAGGQALRAQSFQQRRLKCVFRKGIISYAEFNLRLFFWLLFRKMDCVCAIDLDTILPCYIVSRLRNVKRVYDAHELFCEMQEIVERPRIYKTWKWIEKKTVPHFPFGYTVNGPIAQEFYKMYGVQYDVIMNATVLETLTIPEKKEKYILYQGAVNKGRCFETLIPAMRFVDARLLICGDGNFMQEAKELALRHEVSDKIVFLGMIAPDELKQITLKAWVGVTLFEQLGRSNYISLANRFFDYLHAGVPQICVDYPVYNDLNNEQPFAVLIKDTDTKTIGAALNKLLHDDGLYTTLQHNCLLARQKLNWQYEEKKLISFYRRLMNNFG